MQGWMHMHEDGLRLVGADCCAVPATLAGYCLLSRETEQLELLSREPHSAISPSSAYSYL